MKPEILGFEGKHPKVSASAFVAPGAVVLGDVTLGPESSVWYGCVLRGDVMSIVLGAQSNLQDLSVVHVTTDLSTTVVGGQVTVGHRVILHGCEIGDRVLVGMGSIVLDLAVIESDVILGAGSLVAPRQRLASGYLYLGTPARRIRALTPNDHEMIEQGWRAYVDLGRRHG